MSAANVKFATLVLKSKNEKVGDASATYASIDGSCPKSCAHKDKGCYAQAGNVGIHSIRLNGANNARVRQDAREVARSEARQIKAAILAGQDTRPLRLHVAGDCRTVSATRALAKAAKGWHNKVWTYTHAWKDVPRENWGTVSVLASVDRAEDMPLALEMGYAPAVVVDHHPENGKAHIRSEDGIRVIPCPAQTREVTCVQCGLCLNANRLLATKSAISFAAHGSSKRRMTVIK